jgi:hypothetical protein
MRKYAHLVLVALLLLVVFWQSLFWGGAAAIPDLGPIVRRSAMREAPLVAGFIFIGEGVGKLVPSLRELGQGWADRALAPAKERLLADPDVAMDFIFNQSMNATQRTATRGVYAVPLLLVLAVIAYLRRPRQVRMMGGRR